MSVHTIGKRSCNFQPPLISLVGRVPTRIRLHLTRCSNEILSFRKPGGGGGGWGREKKESLQAVKPDHFIKAVD